MADVDDNDVIEHEDDALEFQVEDSDDLEVEIVDDEVDETGEADAAASEGDDEKAEAPAEEDDEDAAPSDDDDLTAEDEAEINSYSKNVKKRILREIRAKKRVEAELETVKAQAGGFIAKLSEEGRKTFSRAEALQKQYDDMQDSYATLLENSLLEKSQFLQERLRRARDDGDSNLEAQALSELQTIAAQRGELTGVTRNIKDARATRAKVENIFEQVKPTAQQGPRPQPPTPRGAKWKESRTWYGKAKYAEATEYAHIVDRKLVAEGMNPNSKEFLVELDRRIQKRFPELYKNNKPKTTTGAPVPSSPKRTSSGAKPGKVTLTKNDLRSMQKFGLDPNNKAHLRAWAENKGAA